jgi:sulfite exporter TauE/SafE
MFDTFITHLQIFGIGFTFGMAGPCLLTCTPAIMIYVLGTKRRWRDAIADIAAFLSGRLIAYVALGYLAGLSALMLRHFTNSDTAGFFRPLGGAISILLGIIILLYKDTEDRDCKKAKNKVYGIGGMLFFGFVMGMVPCIPLIALLFEIVLIAKTPVDGAFYALSFGLGTFISGFLIMTILTSALGWIPVRAVRSERARKIYRGACAFLLIILGASIIL